MSAAYSDYLEEKDVDKLTHARMLIREVREAMRDSSLDCPDQYDNCFSDGRFCGELGVIMSILDPILLRYCKEDS